MLSASMLAVRARTGMQLSRRQESFPVKVATGPATGAGVTSRLVAPMIGGISVSFVMELLVYPVVFYLWKRRQFSAAA